MITPTVFLTVVMTVIGSLKVFGQIYVMTQGGPSNSTKVLVYYIWEKAFKLFQFGYASALAYVLFFIVMILTLLQWQLRKRWVFNEGDA
ncbi:hypothetical protein N6H13_14820 [Paenibacillus sp. CC-CFT742]|nr:hypothetical protein [Paenibacillus sp. CC-CFT742]WJH31673.1 hypothetical protein N6H13_14820 [Paenibacillus sp. CC-CFT742]